MTATVIHSTKGIAFKGVMVRPVGNAEAFLKGSLDSEKDRLTLAYGSTRKEQVGPRKWQRVNVTRIIQCERRWNDQGDDFWWYGVSQTILSHRV